MSHLPWALALVFTYLSFWEVAVGDPRATLVRQVCGRTEAVSTSLLATNFVSSMDNLSTVVNQNGFGTSIVGEGINAVFGFSQCYEDLSALDCKLCFSEIRSLLPKCYPNISGIVFFDGCFGRYDNYSFFNEALGSNDAHVCSQNSSNSKGFDEVVKAVVSNVSLQAQSKQGYAVGSASSSNITVYALAQCWENLDQALCRSCLNAAASSIVSCSPALEGRATFTGCFLRYSTILFWNVQQSTSGNHNVLWIILGCVIGGLVLVFVIVAWEKRKSWNALLVNSSRDNYEEGVLPVSISQSSLNFNYEELKKATKKFDPSNKLGQGSYGTVYKAVLSDGKEVAVKKLFWNTRQWIEQFYNEVNLINRVRHRYLVKLLGCSIGGPESLLVYEYYPNRSLDLFLFVEKHDNHLVWQQRLEIILGVAEGLCYLHEELETPIIHRDIKASNILLDENFKPKITDFGLAKSFSDDRTHLTTGIAGTVGYMAPEYIMSGHLTKKSDVYSYGILILEIVTGKRCNAPMGLYAGNSLLAMIWNNYKANTVENIVDECIYEKNFKNEIQLVLEIGLACTQENPRDRPAMSKVMEFLRSGRTEGEFILTDPPFLDISSLEHESVEASGLLTTGPNSVQSQSSLIQFGR